MTPTHVTRNVLSTITACTLVLAATPAAHACTGIRLTAADGTVVHARTLEFGTDLQSNILMIPRGFARTGTTPDGKEGLKWKAKYASVGANGAGLPVLFDGLNEKGLAAGLFYFPTSAGYMPYTAADAPNTMLHVRGVVTARALRQPLVPAPRSRHASAGRESRPTRPLSDP